jgi:hypothetical protein
LIKMRQPLLTLFEQIHRPFVQRLIALLVSGLIALLLGGAFLLSGHGAFVTHLPMQAGSAGEGMVVEWLISTSLPATGRVALAVASVIPG